MKILQIHKYYSKIRGGGSVSAFFETKALLERRGHSVVVFSMDDPTNESSPYSHYFAQHFDLREMNVWQKMRHIPKVLYNRDAAKKLDKLLTIEKPDVAHVHNIYHYLTPSIFPILKKHKIPIVFKLSDYHAICPNYKLFAHGEIDESCRHKKYYKLFFNCSINNSRSESFVAMLEGYVNRLFRLYDYVNLFLAPSIFMQKICGEYGISGNKIVVLRNVLTLSAYQHTFEKKKYILYMGRIAEEKGLFTLLEAVHLLVQQGKMQDYKCIIAGHGPEEENLKQFVHDNHLGEHIHFVGFCKKWTQQWEDLQRNAAISVLPSIWYDNSPIAISEAMAFGTPVIVSNIGGTKEMITEGKSGLTFEARNVPDLADKIELLITDKMLSHEMRRNVRERVTKINNEETYYADLMMYYGMVIKKNKQKDMTESNPPLQKTTNTNGQRKNSKIENKTKEHECIPFLNTSFSKKETKFLNHLSLSFFGGIIGALLLLSANILAGRYLGPTEYGYYAIVYSIAQFIALFLVIEVDVAMIRFVARDIKLRPFYQSAAVILFAGSISLGILLLIIFSPFIVQHFDITSHLYWLAIILALSFSIKRMVDAFLRAHTLFSAQAFIRILEGITVLFGLFFFYQIIRIQNFEGYITALIIGGAVFTIFGSITLWFKRIFTWHYSTKILKKLFQFARFGIIGMISNATVKNIDKVIVAFYLGAEVVGLYMAYFTASIVVIARIVQMFVNVYFPTISAQKNIAHLLKRADHATLFLFPMIFLGSAITMTGILYLYGPAYELHVYWIILFALYATVHFCASIYGWLLASISEYSYRKFNEAHFYGLIAFLSILLTSITFDRFSVEIVIIALIANRIIAGLMQRKYIAKK